MTAMPESPPRGGHRSASPLAAALEHVGDRWSLLVVEALLDGPRRYGDLLSDLAGIAPNILAARLRRLGRQRIVVARPYSRRPPRMEYSLTAEGRDLASALRLLADWGARHGGAVVSEARGLATAAGTTDGGPARPEPLRHVACGTPLETRWYCPTCSVTASNVEVARSSEGRSL